MSINDDNFSVGPSHPWFPCNGPEQLNENYSNQQKHYQIIGYLDQIQHRKLKIPESFLVEFNYQTWWNFRSSIKLVIPGCRY